MSLRVHRAIIVPVHPIIVATVSVPVQWATIVPVSRHTQILVLQLRLINRITAILTVLARLQAIVIPVIRTLLRLIPARAAVHSAVVRVVEV